jgi:uncharacterized protein with GYD domain
MTPHAAHSGVSGVLAFIRWEASAMAAYVSLVNSIEKGIREIADTVKRADAFKKLAKKVGATVKELV